MATFGLVTATISHLIDEMHQRTCLFKTTGKRSGEHLGEDITRKKLKDNVKYVSGVLG